eukprot:TRINITY_DN3425_c0_g1_i2.p1 TRINITY_DN3425_c0_g1~~TRINITY_DN3425_c0_g1_i2.p1  ORF type:complete len:228 (-),score=11.54 TRINITY_DN3425_c0_g1_i2:601-1221(-)
MAWLGTKWTVPKKCLQDYVAQKEIGHGSYGEVFTACRQSDCAYVMKVQHIKDDDATAVTQEEFDNEVKVSELMGKVGVGPKVYRSFVCDDCGRTTYTHDAERLGFIVMERLDTTVKAFFDQDPDNGRLYGDAIHQRIIAKIHDMVNKGVVNVDLRPENLMLKLPEKRVYIIDWGLAEQVASTDQTDVDRCLKAFESFWQLTKKRKR